MSMHYLKVTIGSGSTQFTTTRTPIREIFIRNKAGHTMNIGDSTITGTLGIQLSASSAGSQSDLHLGPTTGLNMDLTDFYVSGTAADILDVVYSK